MKPFSSLFSVALLGVVAWTGVHADELYDGFAAPKADAPLRLAGLVGPAQVRVGKVIELPLP